ncbi:hypothetical protein PUW79_05030 [Microbacterium sp. NE2HP2]|uniref:hypothetical protein n=1 Tax=Microbacterium TaxID=33882 RepID=UPI0023662869|nr:MULTISPECIES: hypothetical protein [Microbacterium]MDD7943987.1 hypothetical protein [Microbacterium plantarum]WHE36315.1 hypothetical protein P6897_00900 [Microbacterium sp. BDGP8]
MDDGLRFDRGARYGAAIVAAMFATYLAVASDFSAIVQAEMYAGTITNDMPYVDTLQFVLVVATLVVAFALLPTSAMRRVGGVTVACVALFLWATFGLLRGAGHLAHLDPLWEVVLNQGFIALLAGVGGWVIARGRHPLSWVVVVIALVPPIVGPRLVEANVTSGGYALAMQGIVVVGGLAAVWAAAGVDRWARRRFSGRDAATRRRVRSATTRIEP